MISFFLMMIAVVYLSIASIFTSIAFYRDDIRYSKALKVSFSLVKGRWWLTLGYMLILGIASSLAVFIVTAPLGIVQLFVPGDYVAYFNFLTSIYGVLVNSVPAVVAYFFLLQLYDEYKKQVTIVQK